MTMRDTKKGPIGDKFKEVGSTIKSKLIRNKTAKALKHEAKDLGFRKSEARDIAKRYRRNDFSAEELAYIGKNFMTPIDHTFGGNNNKPVELTPEDAKAISHFGNQDKYGRSKAEQVYDAKHGISPKPLNTEPLDNPVVKHKDD